MLISAATAFSLYPVSSPGPHFSFDQVQHAFAAEGVRLEKGPLPPSPQLPRTLALPKRGLYVLVWRSVKDRDYVLAMNGASKAPLFSRHWGNVEVSAPLADAATRQLALRGINRLLGTG